MQDDQADQLTPAQSAELQSSLKELYDGYNNQIASLLLLVEVRLEVFPVALLNEIRAMHDHVARVYLTNLKFSEKMDEVETAKRHAMRAMLDCHKVLIAYWHVVQIEIFDKRYHGVRLPQVDNGNFYPEYSRLKDHAFELIEAAKRTERIGASRRLESIERYQAAFEACVDLEDFVHGKHTELAWASINLRSNRLYDWFGGFITGVLASYLAGYLPQLHSGPPPALPAQTGGNP